MKIKDSYLNNKKNYLISDILIGITFTIFLISIGLLAAIYFKPLYYLDIGLLNIEKSAHMPNEEIKQNYNVLIKYCSPFYKGELEFPTLPSSQEGLSHFRDVKVIFNIFHLTALFSFIICISAFCYKKHYDYIRHLLIASITTFVLPFIIGIICFINFNKAFTVMHKIFFKNDDWLFDPDTDPIINLLPIEYFMHCAFLIMFIVLLGGLISLLFYLKLRRNNKTDTLLPMKKNYFY